MEQQPHDHNNLKEGRSVPTERRNQGVFQFGPWVFNVDRALQLITEQPRITHRLPVEAWARFYGLAEPEHEHAIPLISPGPTFDRDYAMTTDLGEPVVVATLRDADGYESPLLIDGCHRLYRAYVQGVEHLPAYLLDAEESLAVREGLYLR
jgi:hypothetical protein